MSNLINPFRTPSTVPVRFNYLGETGTETLDRAALANTLYLTKITIPVGGGTVKNLFVRQRAATASGIHLKGVIYSDSAGTPNALLNTGSQVTTATLSSDADIALGFASAPLLAAGDYWFGYLADGAFHADGNNGAAPVKFVAATYASGPPANPVGFSTNVGGITCYISFGDTTPVSSTGFISQTSAATTSLVGRWALPANRAVGDIVFMHVMNINSSGTPTWTTPTGFTLIDDQPVQAASYRSLLYWKRIDGTEGYLDLAETVALGNVIQGTPSLWRGYTAVGTPYEAYATNTGNSATPAGTAITTLGANRTALNFYANTNSNASAAPGGGGANGWADAYNLFTPAGFDCSSTCSWKDVAAASLVPVESGRSLGGGGEWWRSFTLALIKA
jgi:hypothetical protein